jgi:amino acid adenylation domain-containing protein
VNMQEMIAEGFRVSPQQKRVWSLQQPDDATPYRACCAVLIEGPLDPQALGEAWRRTVARHEILRTTFQALPGMNAPLQIISDTDRSTFEELDWRTLELSEQELRLEALFQQSLRLPLNPAQGPLAHLSLISLSPSRHYLLITISALCADAASLGALVEELGRSYSAGAQSAEQPVQYADISEYLNELLESEETRKGREHWRERKAFPAAALSLPFESEPPSASAPFNPQLESSVIAPAAAQRVEALAHSHAVSIASVLLACWQVLLWRLTGQGEIVVGAGYDGRTYGELEKALGLFARYLPVGSRLEGGSRFNEFLMRIDEAARSAQEWQDYFTWEDISGSNEESVGPLFFPFSFDFIPQRRVDSSSGPIFSIRRQYACSDRFRLKLCCLEKDGALLVELHYDPAYLSSADVRRMTEEFRALVESAAENPAALIGELDALGEVERRGLLVKLNQTTVRFPQDKVLHELFEEQAERTPDSIAVVYEGEQLTYRELDRRANQLAQHLRRHGVGTEARVGLLLERSLEMVVGLLAVLKAGAAYVPLDPAYPEERLRYVLSDSGLRVLLTQAKLASAVSEESLRVIQIDAGWELIAGESAEKPESRVLSDNLAYILYTSGSTGWPKGVMISHRALCNHMFWMRAAFPLSAADRVLQKTPLSFDASVWEFYAPLLSGAQLIMARPLLHTDAAEMVETIKQEKITVLQLVPIMLRVLLEAPGVEECRSLKHLFSGGEALPPALQEKFFSLFKTTELHNLYGPTEATIEAAFWTCRRDAPRRAVPIGRPISNTQIYVLDERLRPIPTGAVGELFIGGAGLARGYLNRAELTAERFIPDPFGGEPGARLYRTGDLARYLSGGELEYVGRSDGQVKIRGFRIETGEVEMVLAEHPAVSACAVVASGDASEEKSLAAYVVPVGGARPTTSELRRWLRERLPEYMMPTVFVTLDALPLLPSGKVDRRALPSADQARPLLEEAFVAPQTEMEKMVAAVWAQALGLEQVGLHDNFFDLGGHSLLMVQVHSKLQERLGRGLAMVELFQYPTVSTLARHLSVSVSERQQQSVLAESRTRAETRRAQVSGQRQRRQAREALRPPKES